VKVFCLAFAVDSALAGMQKLKEVKNMLGKVENMINSFRGGKHSRLFYTIKSLINVIFGVRFRHSLHPFCPVIILSHSKANCTMFNAQNLQRG